MPTVLKVVCWSHDKRQVRLVAPESAHRPEMGQWFDVYWFGAPEPYCFVGRHLYSVGTTHATRGV